MIHYIQNKEIIYFWFSPYFLGETIPRKFNPKKMQF